MSEEFDVIIIGAGPAGEHAVGRATDAGLRTALVESELAGGECAYWACIPSKTLLRPGRVVAAARHVPGARQAVSQLPDASASLARRNEMVSDWNDSGQAQWVANTGAQLFRGHGRLSGEREVTIEQDDGSTIRLKAAKAVIIATGSRSATPPITGLAESRHWDNRDATSSQSVPDRLVVLGAGAVGAELAQAWKRLGSRQVTIVELADRMLPSAEPFAGELVGAAFETEGIVLRLGRRAVGVERHRDDGPITITLDDDSSIEADELLVATGRRPRTDDVGLETVGLEPGKAVAVDERLRAVGVPGSWLYALGDANGEALLTHMGKYQARIAVRAISGEDVTDDADRRAVSGVVFTDPQVGSVGLTEQAARDAGIEFRTLRVDLSSVAAAAIEDDDIVGAAQLIIDEQDRTVVGATFVGPDIGELIHSATIAVVGRVTLDTLRHAVAPFPTISELWLELVESYFSPSTAG